MTYSRTIKVLALSTGQGLTTLVSLIATAVLARVLTVGDYATYRQTLLAYFFAAPLLTLGLPTALYYFLPGEARRRRGILYDNLILLTLMGLLFAVFLLLGGSRLLALRFHNPDLVKPLRWMAFYAIFALPASALAACLTVQNRVMQLSVFNVVSRTLSLLFIIVVVLVWRTPYAALKAFILSEGAIFLVGLILMIRAVPLDNSHIEFAGMFKMVKYAAPLGLASILGTLTLQLDKVIVAAMSTPEEFAVYANGAIEIPLIGIITGSIAAVVLVDMRTAIAGNDLHQALHLFHTAALKAACFLLPATCFLLVFAPDVITLLFSAKYTASVAPFRLYLLILPVRIIFYGSALMALGLTRVVLVRSVAELVLNAGLSILAVRLIGPLGAVTATIVTIYLWSVPYNWFSVSRGFRASVRHVLPLRKIAIILVASLAATGVSLISFAIDWNMAGLQLALGAGCFTAAYVGFSILLKTEVRGIIVQGIRQFSLLRAYRKDGVYYRAAMHKG